MPTNLQPEVKDSELASYAGWNEPDVQDPDQPAPEKSSGPVPLLDEDDHVTPETIQQDRPWWMRPTPRMVVAVSSVMAVVYAMFSMFGLWGSSEPKSASTLAPPDATALDQEVEGRMRQLQAENEDLKREQIMGEPLPQSTPQSSPQSQPARRVSTPSQARAVSTPPRRYTVVRPRPTYVTRPVTASRAVPTRPVSRPISSVSPVRSNPAAAATSKQVPTKGEPELDPMEQWLAAANRGHYIAATGNTPTGNTPYGTEAQPAVYTSSSQPSPYSPTTADSVPNQSSPAADVPTYEPLEGQKTVNNPQNQPMASVPMGDQNKPSVQAAPADSRRLLNIGSSASAVLENGVAWTPDGPEQSLSYLLRLEDGFKNRSGTEVLPKDTYLVARMTDKTESGLFFLEVTQMLGPNDEKTPVPPGALRVLAEDGSPLKADLKNKGGRSFWDNAAALIAPGIERAMGAIASSADSLVLEDGDRSLIRSSGGDDNPLAAGIGGVAEGVSEVYGDRLSNSQPAPSAPYFKFDGGKTVRVLVNQDVQL